MGEAATLTSPDKELYQTNFDPKAYLSLCYELMESSKQKDNSRFVMFTLCHLSQAFSSGKYRGQRLIEVGTGPTIHTLISACDYFEEIVVSDYSKPNRNELEKWLSAEEDCFNWDAHIQFVCDLEKKRTPEVVKQTLRRKIKQVLKCDVNMENPFHPVVVEPADCVVSSLCLETACKDHHDYRRSLGTMVGLLREGGLLVLIGDLNETFYTVKGQRFSCVSVSEEFIRQTLGELGLTVLGVEVQPTGERVPCHNCDCDAAFFLLAQKK
ncbi:nicotinamide N-methyltransferase-like [Lampris incognitus]|uniref:nicotinamide N-methyltransferase-like n=1 Tax=Lampris incognitus TaxID=2546036 RepID=UPI0024B60ABF|nr:nicotinamide N-methyltransferase-like [Lampris incognitus]